MEELPSNWADEIKGKRVLIATPMHDGRCCSAYLKSMLKLWSLLKDLGVGYELLSLDGFSIIEFARNELANGFLEASDAEYLMFIDSDMGFDPAYVPLMMFYDKDIITAPSPKKEINWKILKEAIESEATDDIDELQYFAGSYILDGLDKGTEFDAFEMTKLNQAGTGFTLIKREVFEKMSEKPALENLYRPNKGSPYRHVFFRVVSGNGEMIGEDVYFTRKAIDLGFEVWLCPWMEITHVGNWEFHGDLKVVSKLGKTG